jgi:plastocyanin
MTTPTTRRSLMIGAAATGALAALPAIAAKNGTVYEIEIKNFKFNPSKLEVKPGDIIRWTNRDRAPHDATAVDNSWYTKILDKNGKGEVTVTAGMTTDYLCTVHPQMRASLVVLQG